MEPTFPINYRAGWMKPANEYIPEMKSTFPINYRAGWMEPANEYIPEVIPPKPQWQTRNRFPDYGPIVEDDHLPSNHFNESTHAYQKMQYTNYCITEDLS